MLASGNYLGSRSVLVTATENILNQNAMPPGSQASLCLVFLIYQVHRLLFINLVTWVSFTDGLGQGFARPHGFEPRVGFHHALEQRFAIPHGLQTRGALSHGSNQQCVLPMLSNRNLLYPMHLKKGLLYPKHLNKVLLPWI